MYNVLLTDLMENSVQLYSSYRQTLPRCCVRSAVRSSPADVNLGLKHWLYISPVLLSSGKVLVLENPRGPIYKSSSFSFSSDLKSLSLSLSLDH